MICNVKHLEIIEMMILFLFFFLWFIKFLIYMNMQIRNSISPYFFYFFLHVIRKPNRNKRYGRSTYISVL